MIAARLQHLRETGHCTVLDELHRLERHIEFLRQQTPLTLRRDQAENGPTRAPRARELIETQ